MKRMNKETITRKSIDFLSNENFMQMILIQFQTLPESDSPTFHLNVYANLK